MVELRNSDKTLTKFANATSNQSRDFTFTLDASVH